MDRVERFARGLTVDLDLDKSSLRFRLRSIEQKNSHILRTVIYGKQYTFYLFIKKTQLFLEWHHYRFLYKFCIWFRLDEIKLIYIIL